jgi:hypothetical protein
MDGQPVEEEKKLGMFESPYQYIKPYLPSEAHQLANEWEAKKNHNISMQYVLAANEHARCRNCQDFGYVMLRLVRAGPFQKVPNHSKSDTLMWFDGSPGYGRGWYITAKTVSFECPHCMGRPDDFTEEQQAEQDKLEWFHR